MRMRKWIALIALSVLWGCASNNGVQKNRDTISQRSEVRALKIKKDNDALYWGEGIATIKNMDLGKAREVAKERALHDLSQKIRVTVESDISRVIQSNMSDSNENIRESFSQKVRTYTQSALTNTKDLFVVDYPAEGNCTFLIYMSKEEYQQKVNKDLKVKKSAICAEIENGNSAFEQKKYLRAANHWITARQQLEIFFGDLPLQYDLDNDGRSEEVHVYLNEKIKRLFGNMELTFIKEQITYDAGGVLTKNPKVVAKYAEENGNLQSVAKLPIKVEFISGKGRVNGALSTSKYGEADIPLTVDASLSKAVIIARIDKEAVNGLDQFSLPQLSETKMTINKIKTVALAVSFRNGSNRSVPDAIVSEIKNLLLNRGFISVDFRLTGSQVSQVDIKNASLSNADYLLALSLKTSAASTVGGYANMYSSSVSGFVSLYKLPRGDQIATDRINGAKGFGVSADVAGWDAYSNVKKGALTKVRKIIERAL